MQTLTETDARKKLSKLLDQVARSREPILIIGERANAVLISENDWRGIEETLHLGSIPGMRESILEGISTPIEDCTDEPDL